MSTNRENELDGLEREVYQDVWEFRGNPTLSQLSADLMLVSDEDFANMTASLDNLVTSKYLKTDLPNLEEIKTKLHIYDDYTGAVMMLTRYSIM